MTRRPFDQRDPGELPGEDAVIRELEAYSGLTAGEQPHGLADRIMAAVAEEPTPRRGFLAALNLAEVGVQSRSLPERGRGQAKA